MFEVFERYLREWVDISDEEMQVIRAACIEKKVRKWEHLLHDGEIWKINCFIASGCFRLYGLGKDGADHTLRFGIENWWICDRESYYNDAPSKFNVEALSSSVVIIWTRERWGELLNTIPSLKIFNEQLMERGYIMNQLRVFSLISISAEEKYQEFKNLYPKVFNKVPLHMVASYLGISRETLSRVRKEDRKK